MNQLSIVIPSHHRVDLLRLCLESVIRFKPADAEVLVVDDGSEGKVVSVTARQFPDVRVVTRVSRGGFAQAANDGILAAANPIIELLNDDTEVTANWTAAPLERFADRHVVAVAPLVLQFDPDRVKACLPPLVDSAGDHYDPGGFAQKRFHHQRVDHLSLVPERVASVSAAAAFYRREAVIAVGGFPADFGAYFEDVDLSCQLRRAGGQLWFEPRSSVWHRVSASYGRRPSRQILEQQSCNEERLFWRNREKNTRETARHLAVLLGKVMRRIQDGTTTPWIAGRLRGLATEWSG